MYTILQNARLIPQLTENTELTYADLVLEDSRILEIRPAGGTYENACVADLAGKTVIPGMFDLHMHLYFYTADFNALALTTADRNAVLLHAMEYAKVFLHQGLNVPLLASRFLTTGPPEKSSILEHNRGLSLILWLQVRQVASLTISGLQTEGEEAG